MRIKFIFCFLFLLIISAVLAGCSQEPGKYNTFAKCLTEKGAKIYGTAWCSNCKNQKQMFGSSFQYVDYIDCDISRSECVSAGVFGYPTWIIGGEKYVGNQRLARLASLTGCELMEDELE